MKWNLMIKNLWKKINIIKEKRIYRFLKFVCTTFSTTQVRCTIKRRLNRWRQEAMMMMMLGFWYGMRLGQSINVKVEHERFGLANIHK